MKPIDIFHEILFDRFVIIIENKPNILYYPHNYPCKKLKFEQLLVILDMKKEYDIMTRSEK